MDSCYDMIKHIKLKTTRFGFGLCNSVYVIVTFICVMHNEPETYTLMSLSTRHRKRHNNKYLSITLS